MNETTNAEPAVTLSWTMETRHKQRLTLRHHRDDLISWFRLPDDASDQDIVAALRDAHHAPPMLLDAMEEWSDEHTATSWDVEDDYDLELHNIEVPS